MPSPTGKYFSQIMVGYYYYDYFFKKGRKNRTRKEHFAARADNYKMSEDTLLHRKLSKRGSPVVHIQTYCALVW